MNQIQVELQNHMGSDRDIADAAWTSSSDYKKKKGRTDEDVARVLKLLANEKHSVPFESVVFRFWFRLPIAIDRQLMTHRIASHCLTADNMLYFDLPAALKKGKRQLFKMSIADFYDKWNNGIKNKAGIPKKHNNRLKKMKLRSCNEKTGEIEHTTIDNIFNKGINPVFKFTFDNNYTITSTLNHQYLTNKGWSTIGNALGINSALEESPKYFNSNILFSTNGIPAYKNYEYMKNLRNKGLCVQEMANDLGISYHTVRAWLKKHKLSFKKEETYFKKGIIPWNKDKRYTHQTPYKISANERARKSKRAKGANSNFWKGGITSDIVSIRRYCSEKLAPLVFKRDKYTCQNQGCDRTSKKLNAHHIIPLYADKSKALDMNNLVTLCNKCHTNIHAKNLEVEFAKSYNITFKNTNKYINKKSTKLIRNFAKIIKVEYVGKQETYDLSVSGPFHNFVCNGVIVHNSGMSGRYRTMPSDFLLIPEDIDEILTNLKDEKFARVEEEYNNLCLTTNNWYQTKCKEFKQEKELGNITNEEYKRLREFMRGVLPQHNMTERVTIMNLRSFANFIKLRTKPNAQKEIQILADLAYKAVKKANICPIALNWLEQNYWSI